MTTTIPTLTHFQFSVDDDGVAVVLMDRAGESMNTLGPEVAADLNAVLSTIEEDSSIKAVILGSAKKGNWMAGADIRFLRTLNDPADAVEMLQSAQEGFNRLERIHTDLGKPVVAAIDGAAMGGGCELAMACSMRIVTDEKATQLGQPEIQLGVLPAAGGTQRMPRLIGLAPALDLLLTGKPVRPSKAKRLGLVDEVVPREVLMDVAKRRALEAVGGPTAKAASPIERLRGVLNKDALTRLATEDTPMGRKFVFSKARESVLAETKGLYPAPLETLECVRIGLERGFEAGLKAEREAFGRLVVSPQAKALMSIFFATQDLKKENGTDDPSIEGRQISKVAVLGGGLMGGGIAAVNAIRAKTPTRIKEVDDAGVRRGLGYVAKNVKEGVKRRRIDKRHAQRLQNLVTASTDWSGFGNVDLVIEAVFEDLDLKQAMLREVEQHTTSDTIFASNTSSIPIGDIAKASSRPETVIGMHYFSPVEKMPLLEIITTPDTADWVTATCVAFGKKQGKTVIVVNDGPGFYTSRIIGPYMNEVAYLLAEGVPIEDIDRAMTSFGFPVGPVVLMDEVGLDVGVKVAKVMQAAFGERMAAPDNISKLVADGRHGRKNGRGFYLYENGKKGGVDESVYATLGVVPVSGTSRDEVRDRLLLAMVNEAALCLEQGILRSARDGDIGAIFGLGFPPHTGGPFTWIDQQGAATVVAKLEALQEQHGARFAPAQIIKSHAESGATLRQ
ncbi:MAG: fatty acid oxidation complex subunit alpha FadJ [Acidimicrobiia bacterium]|nr:fatty acid oxidation complex subunit alpha FadJ [Acidimicrobiia bacterium]